MYCLKCYGSVLLLTICFGKSRWDSKTKKLAVAHCPLMIPYS